MMLSPADEERRFRQYLQLNVARHSLTWLAAANAVGVLLALLLFYPQWGEALGEWSYGRWMPLHLNWQLYGWGSLPAVGVLLRRFLPATEGALLQAKRALYLWSVALGLGGWSWLHGQTSGKLFLDWVGVSQACLLIALVTLWCVLTWNYARHAEVRRNRGLAVAAIEWTLLGLLAFVPPLVFWASQRTVYPPVDTITGGPTGADLVGSVLMIVLIIGVLPKALSLASPRSGVVRLFWSLAILEAAMFPFLHQAPPNHTDWHQILGMAHLILWIPVTVAYLQAFRWSPASTLWLRATCGWWALLVFSGTASFLPGVLDSFKFTHALVAHAHLAMAGFLTSLNMLLLSNIASQDSRISGILSAPVAFVAWNGALLLHLLGLGGIAFAELGRPGACASGRVWMWGLLRLTAGMVMAGVSFRWAVSAHRIARAA